MGVTANDETLTSFQPRSDAGAGTGRLNSLDIVRGIIMILMAVDHVRVYAGVPAGGPTPGVFFTRWMTHFSAPGFAFLAGTGAFLYGRRLANTSALSRYLLVRGIMLVLLELTIIRLAWTFNTDFAHYNLAGVIWMLGWCMILMAALVHLPTAAIGVIGALIILGQSVFAPIAQALPGAIGSFLYLGGMTQIGSVPIGVLYVIVPWIGVMAAGYWFGTVTTLEPAARRRRCLWMGLGATAAFVVIATGLAVFGPHGENAPPLFVRILNQRKYPASPLFLLMTLGPIIAFIPFAERMKGAVSEFVATFGRVPLFYYLLHIPLIHALAIVVSLLREGAVNPWLFGNHPFDPPPVPPGYRWSLGLLYLVFAAAIAILYLPCRWYATRKRTSPSPWMKYL